ncbi:MAG: hypothetical protein ACE5KZ_04510 [Candidatus Scalinduaceae bacterium]
MNTIGQFLNRLNRRSVVFLAIAAFILIVIILDRLLFSPLYHSMKKLDDELALKKDLIMKYYSIIGMEETYKQKLNELRASSNSIENRLFLSKTEDLAQAKFQEFVKNVARRNGLIVSRSSARKGEIINEEPKLMLVYAIFTVNDVDKVKKIQSFLYNVEYENEKLIFVDELKLRGPGIDTTRGPGFDTFRGVSATITLFAIAKLEART